MTINLGTTNITNIKLGTTLVPRIYLGSTKIYDAPHKSIGTMIQTYNVNTGRYMTLSNFYNNYYESTNVTITYTDNEVELIKATFFIDINDLTKATVTECIVNGVANETIAGLEIPFATRSISYDYNLDDGTASRFNLGFLDSTSSTTDDASVAIGLNAPVNT